MRRMALKEQFAGGSVSFSERYGIETVAWCSDRRTEYHLIRDAVGLTDFSHMQKFRVPEEAGMDFLDGLLSGNVARTRFGRMLHTLLPDQNGELVADCYVANNDDEYIVLCEGIVEDSRMRSIFTGTSVGVEDFTESQVLLGIDGFKAWAVVKELFGADVLGLPYLSIERYEFEGTPVRLFRAGKTSEFGYLVMAPVEIGSAIFGKLRDLVHAQGGGLCGVGIHNDLRLEGRFFNIYAEGEKVKDPLELGLQWMIDFDKEQFPGRDKLLALRSRGVSRKIIGVSAGAGSRELAVGTAIYDGPDRVATVVASCFSYLLDAALGLALFDAPVAFAGLSFTQGSPDGAPVTTISMPPIIPKSLTVKLDEM